MFVAKPYTTRICRVLWGAFVAVFVHLATAQAAQPPSILNVTVPSSTQSNAVLRARFNPNVSGSVRAWFNWGKTTNLANRTPVQLFTGGTNGIVLSNLLTKLATNQTYFFRCSVSNKFGVTRSQIFSFKTKHDIEFLELSATNIESDRALLTATFSTEHSGITWFHWGKTTNMANGTVPTNYVAGMAFQQSHHWPHTQQNILLPRVGIEPVRREQLGRFKLQNEAQLCPGTRRNMDAV
jgi:hypothetical protein